MLDGKFPNNSIIRLLQLNSKRLKGEVVQTHSSLENDAVRCFPSNFKKYSVSIFKVVVKLCAEQPSGSCETCTVGQGIRLNQFKLMNHHYLLNRSSHILQSNTNSLLRTYYYKTWRYNSKYRGIKYFSTTMYISAYV